MTRSDKRPSVVTIPEDFGEGLWSRGVLTAEAQSSSFITPSSAPSARMASGRPALSNGVPTSDTAARHIEPKCPRLWWLLYRALQRSASGLTADDLEAQTGIAGNTIRPRLVELCEKNLVRRTERTRRTRSGRQAYVYEAAR